MRIVKEKDADTGNIISVLENGGLIIFPCETVYGIGCDSQNSAAINKLNEYKQRPMGKPYAIMAADFKMAEQYIEPNQTANNLYQKFLPGPLTIISRGKHKVANGVESETGTLGVRIPNYPFMLKLIQTFGRPIATTSANAGYKKRPYNIADIWENISEKQKGLVDLIIDAGELPRNEPSTIIDTTLDDIVTLRQGGLILGMGCEVLSRSEENTRNIGKELWQKYEKHAGQRAIVFALEGPMGAGKTVFTKGLAKAMGITEEVISPTYNLELEYLSPLLKSSPCVASGNNNAPPTPPLNTKNFEDSSLLTSFAVRGGRLKLIHVDAWRMQGAKELEQLGLANRIHDKSVMVIEWADRVADTIRKYNEEAVVVWVKIYYGPTTPKATKGKENERIISWGVV